MTMNSSNLDRQKSWWIQRIPTNAIKKNIYLKWLLYVLNSTTNDLLHFDFHVDRNADLYLLFLKTRMNGLILSTYKFSTKFSQKNWCSNCLTDSLRTVFFFRQRIWHSLLRVNESYVNRYYWNTFSTIRKAEERSGDTFRYLVDICRRLAFW